MTDANRHVNFEFLAMCSRLEHLQLQFCAETDRRYVDGWSLVYYVLQQLHRQVSPPLRVIRFEVVTGERKRAISATLDQCVHRTRIEDMLLHLQHLESVQFAYQEGFYSDNGMSVGDQARVGICWERLSAKGVLHYRECESDSPAVFKGQYQEIAHW